ncbi:MAG TPA: phosphoserine phosphatase SerB [Hyphomicrobiaceae bacterium]|jgi:phosphoserine phosphatase|nr:phosphoserine phosphatase SerB [Hyphomicrobiaceae bacterium]
MSETTTHALLLTASSAAPGLDETVIAALRPQLAPAQLIDQRWLAEGVAWQGLVVTRAPGEQVALRARLGAALAPRPIDINLVPADPATRRKKLLVADMESTIIEQECLDELAARVGLGERISEITVRAMRGELVFEAALKERVALLKGLDAAILEDIYASRVTLMSGAATLVATMRRHGAHCALVSGGFSFFSERIAARLQFDSQQANTLEIVDGRLAGSVRQPILGREAKLASLKRLTRALQLDASDTLAVGDGANDLSMLRAAGLGVAFRAKPIVAAAAAVRIEHGDLTALLYLQGYARHEFDSGRAG